METTTQWNEMIQKYTHDRAWSPMSCQRSHNASNPTHANARMPVYLTLQRQKVQVHQQDTRDRTSNNIYVPQQKSKGEASESKVSVPGWREGVQSVSIELEIGQDG